MEHDSTFPLWARAVLSLLSSLLLIYVLAFGIHMTYFTPSPFRASFLEAFWSVDPRMWVAYELISLRGLRLLSLVVAQAVLIFWLHRFSTLAMPRSSSRHGFVAVVLLVYATVSIRVYVMAEARFADSFLQMSRYRLVEEGNHSASTAGTVWRGRRNGSCGYVHEIELTFTRDGYAVERVWTYYLNDLVLARHLLAPPEPTERIIRVQGDLLGEASGEVYRIERSESWLRLGWVPVKPKP